MITEIGRVVAIEDDGLWVQTIRKSACASCSAQKGCGQAVLAKMGREPGFIRVSYEGHQADEFQLDDYVEIGIGEDVLMKSTLLVYLAPMIMLLVGILITGQLTTGEGWMVLGGIIGLLAGGYLSRTILNRNNRNARLQPILIGMTAKPAFWPLDSGENSD
ncbi:SoxR reducing system RseC family protein [Halioxenophilus sp. WMMB6]|uniref:SoxR reducing system RseC family protein n=1 Tax=Halioxenophilus sp. WMMB6 TaxID=3073815 RepID=UPI00295EC6B7|nr:SoxR reducing system RseC family protein [Halioxenophilus sp. WMMB6]